LFEGEHKVRPYIVAEMMIKAEYINNNISKKPGDDLLIRITCNGSIQFSDNNLSSNSGNLLTFITNDGDIKILNNFFLNIIKSTNSLLYVYGKKDISIQNECNQNCR